MASYCNLFTLFDSVKELSKSLTRLFHTHLCHSLLNPLQLCTRRVYTMGFPGAKGVSSTARRQGRASGDQGFSSHCVRNAHEVAFCRGEVFDVSRRQRQAVLSCYCNLESVR